jgi:hypothetical protein
MKILMSLLATTKSGAVIEIIAILLIAGTIAYLTSYFYYKALYMKKITALEAEKKALEMENADHTSEIASLKTKITELEK